MVPPAVDNLSLSLPELPIPSAISSRAADRGDGNSFQDVLARAGGNDRPDQSAPTDSSRSSVANSSAGQSSQGPQSKDDSQSTNDSQPTNDAAEKSPTAQAANEKHDTEQAKADDADDVDQGTLPVVTDEKKDDASDHEDKQEPDQAELALAALAAAQAQSKAPVAQTDEVTISDAAKEQPTELVATKSVAVKSDLPATTPVAPKLQKSAEDATTVGATEQVAVADVAPAATDVPADSDTKSNKTSTESITVAEKGKNANLAQDTLPIETPVAAATAAQSTAAPEAAASAVLAKEEPAADKRSDRSDDKTSATDRSAGTTMMAATDVPVSQQTASDAVQTADATAAAAATTISGEKTDHSDASVDTLRTADSGRQPDITGIRQAAAGAEAPRNANSRSASVAFGTLVDQAGAGGLSQGDRVRLVQRVARAVQTAQERGGDLQLRLSPPELGSLRLQVKMTDGALSARLEAETPQAQQVLMDSLPQLRERLADQNIRVERFDVDLMQSGGGGPSNLPDRRQDASQDGSSSRGNGPTIRRQAGSETNVGSSSPTHFVAAGRLDIVA